MVGFIDMICHKVLNLKPQDLISNFKSIPTPAESIPFGVVPFNPILCLDESFYKKLSELGTLGSLVFHMQPYADKKSIHIDIDKISKQPFWPTLNIIIKGQGVMKWFNPTVPGKLNFHPRGKVLYKNWNDNFGEIIDKWEEGKVALVRTDIPHNVWNFSNEERLVISIRWSKFLTWEETLSWFEKNLI